MSLSFPYRIVDLTHTLDEKIPSWTGGCGFHQEIKLDYDLERAALSFRVQQLKMHAGIGTHLDAPAHCNLGKATIDQIDLSKLVAPCVVIDVSSRAGEDYRLSQHEIATFESSYGTIEPHSFVIIRTGWDQFWKQPERYHNNSLFPSVSQDAAIALLEREIVGLGIDTLSPDIPGSGYPVHAALLGAEKYIIENVAHASDLPPKGAFILALPIKTRYGTEAPIRLVGLIVE
jgi:kynurenine formamidase